MDCIHCGRANPEDSDFCGDCGRSLATEIDCPSCGRSNPQGLKFCRGCGARMDSSSASRPDKAAPVPPVQVVSERYEITDFLGEGGRKRVWRAHDLRLGRDVAVAFVKGTGPEDSGMERIGREANAMAKLGDHPNIVNVYDTGDDGDGTYIVSQLMEGGSVADVLGSSPDHRLDIEKAITIAVQVSRALEHAHSLGVIHRDLKPGNVWLGHEGVAQLGDFGLALSLDRSRITQEGMMVGTVAYMSPEQAMGGAYDERSDLYSLGAMLYEMVTGRPPFIGEDSVTIITQHLNSPAVAPSWHRQEVPAALDRLILRLLEKDPSARPQTAAETSQALGSIDVERSASGVGQISSSAPANPMYLRTFVGREEELAQLCAAFDAALSGSGSLQMVVGEPGIGKTSLTEQLATYVGMRGGMTLVGHSYEQGSLSLPYLSFVEALRAYVITREPEELREELGSGAEDVARIVSEVRQVIDIGPDQPADPEGERFRLLNAVTGFLRNAASVQPLLIVLEDIHDADQGTLDLLTYLARNLQGSRLMLVATYRDVEVDRLHPLSSALAELRRTSNFGRVLLRGLDAPEVQRMMSALAGQEVGWGLAEAVHRQTEGNPLFVQEVLRYLAESGMVKREEGQWRASAETPLAMNIPEGLRDVIGKRLSRLSEGCNRLLSVAAVIGREFDLDTLRAVAGLDEEALLGALEDALRVAVLEERSKGSAITYRFTHAFFRQTLYQEMIAPRRLLVHQQVARALEERYAGRLQEHAAELAEHFSHSSDPADLVKAVDYGQMAAERSITVYAYGEAARLLAQCLEVQEVLDLDDKTRRCDLLLALGEALMPAGEPKRVFESIAQRAFELAEEMGDRSRAASASVMALMAMSRYGGPVMALTAESRIWTERADIYASPGTPERVRADLARSLEAMHGLEWDKAWDLRQGALALARDLDDKEAIFSVALSIVAPAWPRKYWDQQRAIVKEFVELPHDGVSPRTLGFLWGNAGGHFLGWGDREQAEKLWREVAALGERTQDANLLLGNFFSDMFIAYLDGRLEESVEIGAQMVSRGEELGSPVFGLTFVSFTTLFPLLWLGRGEEALERPVAAAKAAGTEELPRWVDLHLALVHAYLRTTEAKARFDTAAERFRDVWENTSVEGPFVSLHWAALMLGDLQELRRLYDRLAERRSQARTDDLTGDECLQYGEAAALLDERPEAHRYYRIALDRAALLRDRPMNALVRERWAELLLDEAADESDSEKSKTLRKQAREHLEFAIGELRRMKMQPELERALRLRMDLQGISSTIDPMTSIDAVARKAQDSKPDVASHAAQDGTVTIMFSDMEGFSEMTERLGDREARNVIRAHNAVVREELAIHGGTELELQGDGFLLAFPSARRALACAIEIQRKFREYSALHSEQPIRVRIGMHSGEPIKEGDKFFGKTLILAARIASQADGKEIFVSQLVRELLEPTGEFTFDEGREATLKGLSGTYRLYGVKW